ncbi:MAG: Na(+)-translocating NADH-quinone reductase subunit A [Prevotella sp.]|nr:Na(+)-translocating NADH-quinone reductase subunit A [Candidatus Equicola stercoris]
MTKIIKLRKGLDIKLDGVAEKMMAEDAVDRDKPLTIGLVPDDFVGVKPQVVVKVGDEVSAGDALFVNKQYPDVKFVSPIKGTVTAVVRGERRKVISVVVEGKKGTGLSPSPSRREGDTKPQVLPFGEDLGGASIVNILAEKGLLGYITQMPYAISANNVNLPQRIFVSAFRDMPLAADVDFCLKDKHDDWLVGLQTLAKIAPVYVGLKKEQEVAPLEKTASVTIFEGKCPAGNVNVQMNHVAPINKGEIVWTVEPEVVSFIGELMSTGCVNFCKTIAVCGSAVKGPRYKKVYVGQKIDSVLDDMECADDARIINGNVLTGKKTDRNGFVGAHAYELTLIPEGDDNAEFLGWIAPMCLRNRKPADARIKGGKRNMIMSGEYDKVLPMDIFGEYLVKAIIAKDIDKMEQLGIYEVAPEDFALAEYVDSSKLELQRIVREGLDMLRKENE